MPETPESQPPITSEDETAVNDPMPPAEPEPRAVQPHEVPVPLDDGDELIVEHEENNPVPGKHDVMEVSIEVRPEDITEQQLCLWEVIEDCFVVQQPAKQRRVEVSFRKLSEEDKKRFEVAMKKEWQSWIDNKVTSICKSRGIPRERVIRARWVLVWKKSSDPDDRSKTPKARLVLVGWQDPELGKIATDSPTLKKESKNLILSICAAKKWRIWGADIKTAFLSGDPSERQLYFRPPPEIKRWMDLTDEDLFRLEKAAYGLAEAPRAWFLRLSRELAQQGLKVSQLDRCLFSLRNSKNELVGVCGVHVDDLLGGGTPEMDAVLEKLRKCLPFGDFRTYTIRYTGIEIRQNPNTFAIEINQETYIDSLEPVSTKSLGSSGTPVRDPSLLRRCAGQLAWAAGSTRPDKAFLASYLQGIQDKATVSHVELYNKALREMKDKSCNEVSLKCSHRTMANSVYIRCRPCKESQWGFAGWLPLGTHQYFDERSENRTDVVGGLGKQKVAACGPFLNSRRNTCWKQCLRRHRVLSRSSCRNSVWNCTQRIPKTKAETTSLACCGFQRFL